MTRLSKLAAAALVGVAALVGRAPVAFGAIDEGALVAALEGAKTPQAKHEACRALRGEATAKAVPALAALLGDEELSHSARMALEVMPAAEAGQALRDALAKTGGLTKAGIALSLGQRGERESVAALAPLAGDADAVVAGAAAAALGRIGGVEAVAALNAAKAKAPAAAQAAIADALLAGAGQLLAGGDAKAASAVYAGLYQSDAGDAVRTAAYRGMALSAGEGALGLAQKGLAGGDRPALLAGLKLAAEIPGEVATKAFADVLSKAAPEVQAALAEILGQRGDAAAGPAVLGLLASEQPAVRVAALRAAATLGNAAAVPVLAKAAAGASGAEQEAARAALARLSGKDVRDAIVAQLANTTVDKAARLELIRAAGARFDAAAAPALAALAQGEDADVRTAALRAVGQVATDAHVPDLARLVAGAKSDAERAEAAKVLTSACARARDRSAGAAAVLAELSKATGPARAALLGACGELVGPSVLDALRAGVKEQDKDLRDAAIRALAASHDAKAVPDLLGLAKDDASLTHKVLALRGCVRLVDETTDMTAAAKLEAYGAALAAAPRVEERRVVLGGLARLADPGALAVVEPLLTDKSAAQEAMTAYAAIAHAVKGTHPAAALPALKKVAELATDPRVRQEANAAAAKLEAKGK